MGSFKIFERATNSSNPGGGLFKRLESSDSPKPSKSSGCTPNASDNFFTSKEYVTYMKSTECHGMSIYDRWLKPLNGLNAKTTYQDRYVGNSPEFMPLDNSLNYDLQLSHRYHCIVTAHLPDSDEFVYCQHNLDINLHIFSGIDQTMFLWCGGVGQPITLTIPTLMLG